MAIRRPRLGPDAWNHIALAAVIVLFGAFQVALSWHKLQTLQAGTMDLGDFEQQLWKISHGDWWAFSTVFQSPALGFDVSLWLYPLAYAFRYLGGPMVLFVVQGLGTGFGAWGIYRAARLREWSPRAAQLVAVLFLLYPALLGGSQFDFHTDFLALPMLVWAYVAHLEGRPRAQYALLLAAALAKNLALLSVAGWGIGIMLYERRWREGFCVAAGSAALLGLELFWVIPTFLAHGTEPVNFSLYGYLGTGVGGVLTGFFTRFPLVLAHVSTEWAYLAWILAPVLGLALLGASSVPALVAALAFNMISSLPGQQEITSQFQVILAAWLFLALIEALSRWPKRRRTLLVGATAMTVLFESTFLSGYILPKFTTPAPDMAAARKVAARIPAKSVVFTDTLLGPLIYRHAVFGISQEQVPGIMTDGLPVLWREGAARGIDRTTLFSRVPASPYMATVIRKALAHGYRVTDHRAGFFLVGGTHRFPIALPSPAGFGWEPRSGSWVVPAWTQSTPIGRVNWTHLLVDVPQGREGTALGPFLIVARPGTYRIGLVLDPVSAEPGRVVGALHVGDRQVPFRGRTRAVSIQLHMTRPAVLTVRVTGTGSGRFVIQSVSVHHTDPAPVGAGP